MKNIILLSLLVLLFTFITKPIESLSVNFKCKKNNSNYVCKEENTFSSIINNVNETLNYYKESAQKKYNHFKKKHDKEKNELESHFGKIKV